MLYRILTENKNYDETIRLVSEHFTGFTAIKADGYWKNESEHSLIIEICPDVKIGDGNARTLVEHLAYAIKKQNGQESVLVQRISCQHDFL